MDAFYASVEALDNPELRGKPLIVGGTGGRGVVAAASYEVRKYGVHSAMPMSEALRRCPHAICVRPRFERYKEVSKTVFGIFHEYTPLVQGLSLDEAFLDVTESQAALGDAATIAVAIKKKIVARTGVTASVGVAPNKLVAKIASDLRKPDGLVVVREDEVTALLDPLPIGKLYRHRQEDRAAPGADRHPHVARPAARERCGAAARVRSLRGRDQGARGRHRRAAGDRRLGRETDLRRRNVRHGHQRSRADCTPSSRD